MSASIADNLKKVLDQIESVKSVSVDVASALIIQI